MAHIICLSNSRDPEDFRPFKISYRYICSGTDYIEMHKRIYQLLREIDDGREDEDFDELYPKTKGVEMKSLSMGLAQSIGTLGKDIDSLTFIDDIYFWDDEKERTTGSFCIGG